MNKLFERFIFVQLSRTQPQYFDCGLRIAGQVSKRFWSFKTIRPDVMAEFNHSTGTHRVILDTKWKVPKDGQPADDDLKQMYAYNVHLGARRSVLAYPMAGGHQIGTDQPYEQSASLPTDHRHGCATFYINLFDEANRLRKNIGKELIQKAIFEEGAVGAGTP